MNDIRIEKNSDIGTQGVSSKGWSAYFACGSSDPGVVLSPEHYWVFSQPPSQEKTKNKKTIILCSDYFLPYLLHLCDRANTMR